MAGIFSALQHIQLGIKKAALTICQGSLWKILELRKIPSRRNGFQSRVLFSSVMFLNQPGLAPE